VVSERWGCGGRGVGVLTCSERAGSTVLAADTAAVGAAAGASAAGAAAGFASAAGAAGAAAGAAVAPAAALTAAPSRALIRFETSVLPPKLISPSPVGLVSKGVSCSIH
jgi:hypothetical protein